MGILDRIIGFVFDKVADLVSVLPQGGLPDEITSALGNLLGMTMQFDFLLPISEAIVLIKLIVAFYTAIFLFKFVKWMIHVLAGMGQTVN